MECGTCTLCCELLPIKQLNKHHSKLCEFCINDSCSIYPTRPEECKNFKCLFLNRELPSKLRPDQTHIIFEKIDDVDAYLMLVDPKYPEAYKANIVESFCLQLLDEGYSILLSSFSDKPKRLRTPIGIRTQDMMDKIMKEIT